MVAPEHVVDTKALENVHTVLHDNVSTPHVSYEHVPWKLHVRKEVWDMIRKQLSEFTGVITLFCRKVDLRDLSNIIV